MAPESKPVAAKPLVAAGETVIVAVAVLEAEVAELRRVLHAEDATPEQRVRMLDLQADYLRQVGLEQGGGGHEGTSEKKRPARWAGR